ncbi:MAG: hypothetical protein HQ521_03165 [Bacteroidetes bacterium]|nr:hypothetical protein [Bacteroidota bacterium]
MKKFIPSVIFLLLSTMSYSQVMGISASKLASINAGTATKNQIEFEPGFGYYWATKYFDSVGKIEPLSANDDSTDVYQEMTFRITYGITDKFEAGLLIASDMSSVSLGTKYHLFTTNNFSGAVIAGGTFANESDIVAVNSGIFGKTVSLATGLAFSNEFSQKLSLDFDIQYQCLMDNKVSYSNDLFANAELAYIFKNRNQLIGGFSYTKNYHTHQYDGHQNQLLIFNVGASIRTGEMFELVFYTPIALTGSNFDRLNGFNFALTIFIN